MMMVPATQPPQQTRQGAAVRMVPITQPAMRPPVATQLPLLGGGGGWGAAMAALASAVAGGQCWWGGLRTATLSHHGVL
jgi:hypothetical protein